MILIIFVSVFFLFCFFVLFFFFFLFDSKKLGSNRPIQLRRQRRRRSSIVNRPITKSVTPWVVYTQSVKINSMKEKGKKTSHKAILNVSELQR